MVKIIETPRDGFQGLPTIIETDKKVEYINQLLQCGFHTVEVGSFVSPKLIPQMADTAQVIKSLTTDNTNSNLAVLVVTKQGADRACEFEVINELFFPFSVSSTFLQKNIKQTIEQAVINIHEIQNLCVKNGKQLITYFSMGFESSYGNNWSMDMLYKYVEVFTTMGLKIFPFSDIFGNVSPMKINEVFNGLKSEFAEVEFGLHLHSLDNNRLEKVDAAYKAGIRRFDTVINGIGGCPQTGKELIGNLPLQEFLRYCSQNNIPTNIDEEKVIGISKYNLY